MLTFTYIIKTGGMWVRQLHKAIGLMQVIQDDTTRDLYWCVVLKFLREFFLTTPSEEAIGELLGFLEPMCDDEVVHEYGTVYKMKLAKYYCIWDQDFQPPSTKMSVYEKINNRITSALLDLTSLQRTLTDPPTPYWWNADPPTPYCHTGSIQIRPRPNTDPPTPCW